MYKVIKSFVDLQDGNHLYKEGDIYPREGAEVSSERQKELAGTQNKIGEPLIKKEKVADEEKPKKSNK